jgi:hypothetical protein
VQAGAGLLILIAFTASCGGSRRGELMATFLTPVLPNTAAVGDDAVYLFTMNSLMRVPLSGGSAESLVDDQFCCRVGAPHLTASEVIWAQPVTDTTVAIRAIAKRNATRRRTIVSDERVAALATDGSAVFWTSHEAPGSAPFGSIRSSPIEGGAVAVLLTVPDVSFQDLVVDSSRIYFTQVARSPSTPAPSGMFSLNKDGTDLRAMRVGAICCLSVDPPRLFWVENQELRQIDLSARVMNDVGSIARNSSSTPPWLGADRSGGVAVHSSCDWGESEFSPSHCGGVVVDVGSGDVLAYADDWVPADHWWTIAAAIDAANVYWAPGGRELRRVSRR